MKVTVIIPTRNEEKHIEESVNSILNTDFPKSEIEIFIIDGISDDKTYEIAQNLAKNNKNIKALKNSHQTVPYALNMGIKKARGKYIVRADAHSKYSKDYIKNLLYHIEKLKADNVGGSWIVLAANDSVKAKVIAAVMSHPFGVGNAHYRIGSKKIREVDTVPFGCFRKELFDKIGFFDEDLTRNQDDEFNARIIKNKGKIFLIPDIKINYVARETFCKLFAVYYEYGLFKPMANIKLGKPATVRQFIPPLFTVFLIIFAASPFFMNKIFYFCALVFGVYLLMSLFFSVKEAKRLKIWNIFLFMYGFFVMHISYGIGYLWGIVKFFIFRRHKKGKMILDVNR
ncbi:MAG: glycosyltransferase [Spirochaetia bacterium]|nr:glycosyltransferase [Spirochaetia bacterium]